jgi:hypothetical protein
MKADLARRNCDFPYNEMFTLADAVPETDDMLLRADA